VTAVNPPGAGFPGQEKGRIPVVVRTRKEKKRLPKINRKKKEKEKRKRGGRGRESSRYVSEWGAFMRPTDCEREEKS